MHPQTRMNSGFEKSLKIFESFCRLLFGRVLIYILRTGNKTKNNTQNGAKNAVKNQIKKLKKVVDKILNHCYNEQGSHHF